MDPQPGSDADVVETPEVTTPHSPEVSFDTRLAPTCMVWSMIAALGFLIFTMAFWGIANLQQLFR